MVQGLPGEFEDYLYRVIASLYRYAERLVVVDYPSSPTRRSIDLIVSLPGSRVVLIKAIYDASLISKKEVEELSAVANSLGVSAVIIAERMGREDLLTGVVYDRYGVNMVNLETFENFVSGREEVYVTRYKDIYTVSISSEKLREKRLEKGLSLGHLAYMLKTSRKSIYEYERGVMSPSVEKAEKLVDILGEEILEPIDILTSPRKPVSKRDFDKPEEALVGEKLLELGFKVSHAKRTVVDLVAGRSREEGVGSRIMIVVKRSREGRERMMSRIMKGVKMGSILSSSLYAVVNREEKSLMKDIDYAKAIVKDVREFINDVSRGRVEENEE
ncbi:putative HTH-type transcriptional regulatory protein [Aeropyrum pernix]|uniref:Putative HTH-type transcriptional regulatory protein apy_10020 n=1 Tax=Aeropyrum pernix TaxID=56636 RepID=A0A401HA47_AERPX|nr:transcriptional regulator [Aeropyrum pernix]GBF09277.1 putative HTH-type transcriptional regulatory protein [Aeropyrum pernix]